MNHKRPPVPAILLVLIVLAFSIYFIVTQAKGDQDGALTASGTIEATQINVSPEMAGKVKEVLAGEGDSVKAGDTLLSLDDSLLTAQRAVASALPVPGVAGESNPAGNPLVAWHVAVLTGASILSASPTAASQIASVSGTPAGPKLAPGKVVERVVSITDTAQRYAVYLPSSYRTDRRWPLLVLMDPRGRAMVPMNLIRDAAERLGYMVISSYNTMSDGPIDPNGAALTAILTDAQKMLALDPRRLYLVGFSGTARSAWLFGYAMRGYVAGIVGVGAGMPPAFAPPERVPGDGPPPVFFASVGTTDFNYDEVRRLEGALPGYGPWRQGTEAVGRRHRGAGGIRLPGLRELENILERALTLCDGNEITAFDLQLPRDYAPRP